VRWESLFFQNFYGKTKFSQFSSIFVERCAWILRGLRSFRGRLSGGKWLSAGNDNGGITPSWYLRNEMN
jgi:hypothetical protein